MEYVKRQVATFLITAVLTALSSPAHSLRAAQISGNLTFAGVIALDTHSAGTATRVDEWYFAGTSGSPYVASADGDFAPIVGMFTTFATPWFFDSGPVQGFWGVGGFTFDLDSSAITVQLPPTFFLGGLAQNGAVVVSGTGSISGNGFDPTTGTWTFTTQDPSSGGVFAVFSFSASAHASPAPTPPPTPVPSPSVTPTPAPSPTPPSPPQPTPSPTPELTPTPPPSPATYTVSLSASPSSGGTVGGGGNYASGATVTVTATANPGYNFLNWTEGGNIVSTSANYVFPANSNRALVANFVSALPTVAMPCIWPNGGRCRKKVKVMLNDTTPGAKIYYTINGPDPTTFSALYTKAFKIKGRSTYVVKAKAVKTGYNDSAVATATITIR